MGSLNQTKVGNTKKDHIWRFPDIGTIKLSQTKNSLIIEHVLYYTLEI